MSLAHLVHVLQTVMLCTDTDALVWLVELSQQRPAAQPGVIIAAWEAWAVDHDLERLEDICGCLDAAAGYNVGGKSDALAHYTGRAYDGALNANDPAARGAAYAAWWFGVSATTRPARRVAA